MKFMHFSKPLSPSNLLSSWIFRCAMTAIIMIGAITAPAEEIQVTNYSYGNTPTPPYTDSTGKELTDGVASFAIWPNTGSTAPLVGWANTDLPYVTFNFASQVTINSMTAWLADGDGDSGVGLPTAIVLTTPSGFSQTFPVTNPPGSGNQMPITVSGFQTVTSSITVALKRDSRYPWIMASEVKFNSPETGSLINRFYDFNGSNLPADFSEKDTTVGFSSSMTGTGLRLSKTAGPTTGRTIIQSMFYLKGDIEATATLSRGDGSTSKGISLESEYGTASQNIYFASGQRLLISSYSAATGFIGTNGGASSAQMQFRLTRSGNNITSSINTGTGWKSLYSRNDILFDQPFLVSLLSIEEAHSSLADNFDIQDLRMKFSTAGNSLPLPAMNIKPGIQLELPTFHLNRYQLETTSDLKAGNWEKLGDAFQGTGEIIRIFDFSRAFEKRFYRGKLVD